MLQGVAVIDEARPADARTDRWSADAACSTAEGASLHTDGLQLHGRGAQIDITSVSGRVSSYYGLVRASA